MAARSPYPRFERQIRRQFPDVAAIFDDPLYEWLRTRQRTFAGRCRESLVAVAGIVPDILLPAGFLLVVALTRSVGIAACTFLALITLRELIARQRRRNRLKTRRPHAPGDMAALIEGGAGRQQLEDLYLSRVDGPRAVNLYVAERWRRRLVLTYVYLVVIVSLVAFTFAGVAHIRGQELWLLGGAFAALFWAIARKCPAIAYAAALNDTLDAWWQMNFEATRKLVPIERVQGWRGESLVSHLLMGVGIALACSLFPSGFSRHGDLGPSGPVLCSIVLGAYLTLYAVLLSKWCDEMQRTAAEKLATVSRRAAPLMELCVRGAENSLPIPGQRN